MNSTKKKALSIIALLVLAGGAALFLWNNNSSEPTTTPAATETASTVRASITVDGATYNTEIAEGSTLLAFMEKTQEETAFSFTGKNTEGIGFFVEEINGVTSTSEERSFWAYYVNGQQAQVGVSDYIVQSGDTIEWKKETY